MRTSGIMIGSFEPLHLGHLRHILYASSFVDTLHLIIVPHPNPNPRFQITLQDKARWLQMACSDLPFIQVHICDDTKLPLYENVTYDTHSQQTYTIDKVNAQLKHLANKFTIATPSELFMTLNCKLAIELGIESEVKSFKTDLDFTISTLPRPTHVSPDRPQLNEDLQDFDSYAIHQNPLAHWDAIHPEARGDYTRTLAIVGGESSGKTTLVHKLANYYGASFALEMGRLYVGTDLGGTEVGLQYSDYAPIALDHAQAVRDAKYQAPAPITIVDTDYVTTQAFCEIYEGRTHPFVSACIDEFRFDYTVFLANNTPWVADGMRSLGSKNARAHFEDKLTEIFERHHIAPYRIVSPDYFERYKQALDFIDTTILSIKQ